MPRTHLFIEPYLESRDRRPPTLPPMIELGRPHTDGVISPRVIDYRARLYLPKSASLLATTATRTQARLEGHDAFLFLAIPLSSPHIVAAAHESPP
jgi:hypothetical protein